MQFSTVRAIVITVLAAGVGAACVYLAEVKERQVNTRFEIALQQGVTVAGFMLPRGDYRLAVAASPHVLREDSATNTIRCEGTLRITRLEQPARVETYQFTVTKGNWAGDFSTLVSVRSKVERLQVICEVRQLQGPATNSQIQAFLVCRAMK